jgi:hypothetical protein
MCDSRGKRKQKKEQKEKKRRTETRRTNVGLGIHICTEAGDHLVQFFIFVPGEIMVQCDFTFVSDGLYRLNTWYK